MDDNKEKWRVDLYIQSIDGPVWVPAMYTVDPSKPDALQPQYLESEEKARQVVRYLRNGVNLLMDHMVRCVRVNE